VSLWDALIGTPPEAYDLTRDPRLGRNQKSERRHLGTHVDEDMYWRAQFNSDIYEMRTDLHGIRKLLLIVILLLAANKIIDVGVLSGLFGQ
jgi:hypothetical protein